MKEWLRVRPWIWIVLLMALFVVLDIVLVLIAVKNHPTVLN